MTEIVVSMRDGVVSGPDGVQHRVHRGRTLADAAHPIVQAYPHDWQPMVVELSVEGGGTSHAGSLQQDNDLDELRNDLAEAEETAEVRGAELQRLADGLVERGYSVQGEHRPGWVVDLAFEAIDTGIKQQAPPAPVRAPRAPKVPRSAATP